jgi:hypothetical protein
MAIPAGITSVTVTNTYVDAAGNPLSGYVTFTPSITAMTDDYTVPKVPVRATLDADGEISVTLAATDDTDWEASDFTYTVQEVIGGNVKRTFSIEVPVAAAGSGLDLSTVTPVDNPTVPPSYATTESISYVFENPSGANSVVWRAPKALQITAVRGQRVGGTGATINVQNGVNDVLSADLSLTTTGAWQSGTGLQNTSVNNGATITLELASISGTPSKVYVQMDYQAVI